MNEKLEEQKSTYGHIPRFLKTKAYNLYGRNGCTLCGSKTNTDLHHIQLPQEGNPYHDTKPWMLIPLCRSCHRKVELIRHGGLLRQTMYWIVKKKRAKWREEQFQKTLEEYLDAHINEMKEDERIPLTEYGEDK